jgi:hypothetical protein
VAVRRRGCHHPRVHDTGPFTFLYAEHADPSWGPVGLLPGWRPTYTNRGLPDLVRDEGRCVPGIVWKGVAPPPESPFKGDRGTAVLVEQGGFDSVLPVLIRRQRRGGEPTSPRRELMEAVRNSAELCGFPFSWVKEGLPLDEVERAFGKAVDVRVRSVADRVSRGLL